MRLEKVINKLIHPDQTVFIKGRQAPENMRRLFHAVAEATNLDTPCAVLSLDAEEAFDRLEWEYLWLVLEHFGFGARPIHRICTMYVNPSSVMSYNQDF